MQVEASMPLTTVMSIDFRAFARVPVANTKGSTPRMNANEVIRIERAAVSASADGRGSPPR
jgi:hypothetical protein